MSPSRYVRAVLWSSLAWAAVAPSNEDVPAVAMFIRLT